MARFATLSLALALCAGACGGKDTMPAQPSTQGAPVTPPPPSNESSGAVASRKVRYVALGDSFTIGTGSNPSESFPARLGALWSSPTCTVIVQNLGVNGYTSARLISEELPVLQAQGADIVTLAIGANDIVRGTSEDAYRANLKTITQAIGKTPFVAIPQPSWWLSPAAQGFGTQDDLRQKIARFNAILAEETKLAGGTYVDLDPLMAEQAERGELATDALHPSSVAYAAWADALAPRTTSPCQAR